MASEAPSESATAPIVPTPAANGRSAWWVRALAVLPFGLLYRIADLLGWLAFRVFPHREHVVRENLSKAFPELDEAGLASVRRLYYLRFADVLVEVIKSVSLEPEEIRRRVRVINLESARALLTQGKSVLLVAAHQ